VSTIALSKFCDLFPPIDAIAISDTQCLLLLSQPADPALDERRSALVMVDRDTASARVLGEFPGAAQMVLWAEGAPTGLSALVTSPGGILWQLSSNGSVEQIDNAFGDDGPERYGCLNCCVQQDGFVYVGGMSNQLYRTPVGQVRFERLDDKILDHEMDDLDAAIYGLADMGGRALVAVGGAGMALSLQGRDIHRLDSGTNLMVNAVCPLDAERFLACGVRGLVLEGSIQGWCRAADSPGFDGYLSDLRIKGRQIVWIGGQTLFESSLGDGWNELAPVADAPAISRFARGGTWLWAVGTQQLGWSADAKQWLWLPTASVRVDVAAT